MWVKQIDTHLRRPTEQNDRNVKKTSTKMTKIVRIKNSVHNNINYRLVKFK